MFQFLAKWFRADNETLTPPMLDGPWSANDRLEAAKVIASAEELDGVCVSGGRVYVAARDELLRVERGKLVSVAQFGGAVSAIAAGPRNGLVIAVEGHGLLKLDSSGNEIARTSKPAKCVTALVCDDAGTVYFCEGSQTYPASEWYQDLMRLGASGGVGVWASDEDIRWIAREMRYPNGIALLPDGRLLVSEAWAHRIVALDPATGKTEPVLENLSGYPARIGAASGGGYWLSVFALRTLLVDFVLTEDAFRNEMIETIDPAYWVRPALASGSSYLEPLQGGAIVKLGIA